MEGPSLWASCMSGGGKDCREDAGGRQKGETIYGIFWLSPFSTIWSVNWVFVGWFFFL